MHYAVEKKADNLFRVVLTIAVDVRAHLVVLVSYPLVWLIEDTFI